MKKYTDILNEKIYIENKTTNKSILFTDIIESSDKWKNSRDSMIIALEEQSLLFDKLSDKYNGVIIKTIGDAYMIAFENIKDSIEFGIDIQKELKDSPIKVDDKNIQIRIGICYGDVHEGSVNIQNIELVDYFGNVVNSAARIEGKVSNPGAIAFASLDENIDLKNLLKDYEIDVIRFQNEGDEVKRSSRLLTDIQRYYYKDVKELKGIEEIDVYRINL